MHHEGGEAKEQRGRRGEAKREDDKQSERDAVWASIHAAIVAAAFRVDKRAFIRLQT
jgi:hypothetical protein